MRDKAALGAAVMVGSIFLRYVWNQYKSVRTESRRQELLAQTVPSTISDESMTASVRKHGQLHLENMMIEFKRQSPGASFEAFVREHFPENSLTDENGILSCDPRLRNENWEGAFQRISPADSLHQIVPLPHAS
mmetsp:Transcript_37151/g.61529  ORF Transcript_37151/g.61529 Transcript_37151/m.61529 type:complete len:134 (+) Transcript_37151:34-435(+)